MATPADACLSRLATLNAAGPQFPPDATDAESDDDEQQDQPDAAEEQERFDGDLLYAFDFVW